jgi:hypothetical protein
MLSCDIHDISHRKFATTWTRVTALVFAEYNFDTFLELPNLVMFLLLDLKNPKTQPACPPVQTSCTNVIDESVDAPPIVQLQYLDAKYAHESTFRTETLEYMNSDLETYSCGRRVVSVVNRCTMLLGLKTFLQK